MVGTIDADTKSFVWVFAYVLHYLELFHKIKLLLQTSFNETPKSFE